MKREMTKQLNYWLLLVAMAVLPLQAWGATSTGYVKVYNTITTMWKSVTIYTDTSKGIVTVYCGSSIGVSAGTVDLTCIKTNYDGTGDDIMINALANGCFKNSTVTDIKLPNTLEYIYQEAFLNCTGLQSITLPATLKEIGDYAFKGCTSLTAIAMPAGVTTLGLGAFMGCTSLASVTWPASLTSMDTNVFEGCTSLTTVTLPTPSVVKTVPDNTFKGCTNLTTVTIPEGYTKLGASCFYECSRLKNVTLPSTMEEIGSYAFYSCKELPAAELDHMPYLTTIGNYAYQDCTALASIKLPASLTSMKASFRNCTSLAAVTVPASVKTIDGTFGGCTALENVVLAEGLESITGEAFSRTKLSTIDLPSTVKEVGKGAFYSCQSLTGLELPAGLTTIGNQAFMFCSKLAGITVPEQVTSIGKSAFSHSGLKDITILGCLANGTTETMGDSICKECPDLETVTIGAGVVRVGKYAFYKCPKLKTLNVAAGVQTIDQYAFSDCTSLQDVIMPETDYYLTIGNYAFQNTTAVETVQLPKVNLGSYAFMGCGVTNLELGDVKFVTQLGSSTSASTSCFSKCLRIEEVTVPGAMGSSMFNGCTSLKTVHLSNSLTEIPMYAFAGCTSLTDINIPAGMKTYGNSAFANCSALTEIPLSAGVSNFGERVFEGCTGLTELNVPDQVTSIGMMAFARCTNVTVANVPTIGYMGFDGCTSLTEAMVRGSVDDRAFHDCPALNKVTITAGTVMKHAFYIQDGEWNTTEADIRFEVILAEGVTRIADYAFENCPYITEITIPSTVTEWGIGPFTNCKNLTAVTIRSKNAGGFSNLPNLTTVTLEEGVELVGGFSKCTGLTEIDIPASVTTVDSYAFQYCENLAQVNIANGSQLQTIGNFAFEGCTSLQAIAVPATVTSIGGNAFNMCENLTTADIKGAETIGSRAFAKCYKLAELTLPEGLKTIEASAFLSCTSLTTVDLPASLQTILEGGFNGCSSLAAVNIPMKGALQSIGKDAFNGCTALKAFTLPKKNGSTILGQDAFKYCTSLERFTVFNPEPWYSYNAFDHSYIQTHTTLYVPYGCAEAFNTDEWQYFKERIEMAKEQLPIDEDNFPDEKLRGYLLAQDYGDDAMLSDEEISGLTLLNVSGQGIKSMQGVGFLTFLTVLDVHGNPIDGEALNNLIKELPVCTLETPNVLRVADKTYEGEGCEVNATHVYAASMKGWTIQVTDDGTSWRDYDDAPATSGAPAGLRGDVNGDGKVTITDAVTVVNIILSGETE